jgi:CRP-like cAMP-binding protein
VCLNPNYSDKNTPEGIRDWLDLIYQSIHNPERPVLNIENQGIKKAAELISFDNLTPEERAESKNKEAAKVTIFKREEQARTEERALAEAEKEMLRKEANEARRQKEEALRKQEEALRNSVQGFLEFGATKEQIAKKLNLSQEEVERIVNKLG